MEKHHWRGVDVDVALLERGVDMDGGAFQERGLDVDRQVREEWIWF